MDNHEKYEEDCRDTGGTPEECIIPEPTLADFSADPTPFKEAARTALEVSTVFVALAAFMIAASFIGAEYSSGSIANWLTFVPRRGRVFWSKLLTMIGFAALLGAFAAALVLCAARSAGPAHGSPIESFAELGAMGGRSVLAVIGLAVLGFCAALLTRHTAGAIGVLLGYAVVWFVRSRAAGLAGVGAAADTVDSRGESRGNRGARLRLLRADREGDAGGCECRVGGADREPHARRHLLVNPDHARDHRFPVDLPPPRRGVSVYAGDPHGASGASHSRERARRAEQSNTVK